MQYKMKIKTIKGDFYVWYYFKKERLYVKYCDSNMMDITSHLGGRINKDGFVSLKPVCDLWQTIISALYSILYRNEFTPSISAEEFSNKIQLMML